MVTQEECRRVMDAWAKRCYLVAERNGEALQDTRNIHNTAYIDVLDGS